MCELSYYGGCKPITQHVSASKGVYRTFDIRNLVLHYPEQEAFVRMDVKTTDFQEGTYSSIGTGLCGAEVAELWPTAVKYTEKCVAKDALVSATSSAASATEGFPLPTPDELVGKPETRYCVYYAPHMPVTRSLHGEFMAASGEIVSGVSETAFSGYGPGCD